MGKRGGVSAGSAGAPAPKISWSGKGAGLPGKHSDTGALKKLASGRPDTAKGKNVR